MKNKFVLLALCAIFCCGGASAQPAKPTTLVGKTNPNPHIGSQRAPADSQNPPDAPKLPYHFVKRAPLPQNVVLTLVPGVALTPQGHTLFLSRNPQAMLLEFDKNDKFIRGFDPNIVIGPHGLRVDRHGDIWVTD